MKKEQYIFLIFIVIILYLLYLILDYKYKEYKINSHIEIIERTNENIAKEIEKDKETLEYISTKAYKNKVLKEEQAMKNKWETVIYITNEEKYNKFSKENVDAEILPESIQNSIQDSMSVPEKWIYFLFNKDIR